MALFTDAAVLTLEDLLLFEASLVQVASTHGINVQTKINLALSGIADRVMIWLLQVGLADPQWMNRRALGLSTVVVTPPLHKWICFDALARVFAEAYNVQLNTRFQGKWQEYQKQAEEAAQMAMGSGVGVVANPLPMPALPLVSIQAGLAPAESMFIQTAWLDASGNESAASPVNGIILSGQSGVVVSMAEGLLNAPTAAVGWNVYASTIETAMTRQNTAPLLLGSTWQLPDAGLIQGAQPPAGQLPDHMVTITRRLQRG